MDEIVSLLGLQHLVIAGETEWGKYGDVKVVQSGNLLLFNYTQEAQFANRWNFFERISRGLVLNRNNGNVVARPFDKFFNYDEAQPNTTDLVEVTEKMDGSLGILLRDAGEYRVVTRGAFMSDQAIWATEYLNAHYDLKNLPQELTLLFEIIYPQNRIVVDYNGYEGLVLIGARDRFTGEDYYFSAIRKIADAYGFRVPLVWAVRNVEEALDLARVASANEEGCVLRFADGVRYKVKGDAYKLAHKLLTGVSFKRVLESMAAGTLDEWLNGVPDEFLTTIRDYEKEIVTVVMNTINRVNEAYRRAPKDSRKDYALWVREHCLASDQAYMFATLDGRDIRPLIYQNAFKDRQEMTDGTE